MLFWTAVLTFSVSLASCICNAVGERRRSDRQSIVSIIINTLKAVRFDFDRQGLIFATARLAMPMLLRESRVMPLQIVPVIVCGGAGTRLWPVSRESMPKQFFALVGTGSMFQQVLERVNDPTLFARPIVITHADFRFVVAEQLRECGIEADIVLEPVRRDSVPPSRSRPCSRPSEIATRSSWC